MMKRPQTSLKKLMSVVVCFMVLIELVFSLNIQLINADPGGATRGEAGDLWADKEFGKRAFGEISVNMPLPDKVHAPGGVVVDRSVSPGYAYVWDSGNNRILGINLANCYAADSNTRCTGEVVIGQPSGTDWGSCNQNASFQFYPERTPATASTICGIPEWTHTTLEHKTFTAMYVDGSGNLYVADYFNNRVLKYITPFTTDTVADEVWGQTGFTGNKCNQGGNSFLDSWVGPTATTLCFDAPYTGGSGVTMDAAGNLWVADGGNNRVLRYPNNSGTISKTADFVLGQPNFTSHYINSGLSQLWAPNSVGVDGSGNVYVNDSANGRVLKYTSPQTIGMTGSVVIDNADLGVGGVASITMDPSRNYFWTMDPHDGVTTVQKWDLTGTPQLTAFDNWEPGGGSLGFDNLGNVLVSAYGYHQDVSRYTYSAGSNTYTGTREFFSHPGGGNLIAANRLQQGGWGSVRVLSNGQMVVTDGRLLYWNDPLNEADGATPDGYVGASSLTDTSGDFLLMDKDKDDRLYIEKNGKSIAIYQGPLTNSSTPIKTLTAPFNLLGGGTIDINTIYGGIAASDHGEYLWLSSPDYSRVIRVRGPLTANPVVDIVLGQKTSSGTSCNQGVTTDTPSLDMLCAAGALRLDNYGNLYVSDHFFEISGNFRMLMFAASTFPASPSSVIYDPSATKEFPGAGVHGSSTAHATFEPSFDSGNRMVVGGNPYQGIRWVSYYNTPEAFNASNRSDPTYATPDGQLKDFYGWVYSNTFDANDNLYVYDANRGSVQIYFQPFIDAVPVISEVTPIADQNIDSTPNFSFNTTKSGTLSYDGSCSSATSHANPGVNIITMNTLADGTYSNCTITLTDSSLNVSNVLHLTSFTIIARSHMLKSVGDFNGSGKVDLSDLSILASFWNQHSSAADANFDGNVNLSDLSILAVNWLRNY